MPAGVSWSQYIKFSTAAFLSMMAGSQLVHMYYNPLKDIDKFIENELQQHKILKETTTEM